MPLAVETRSLRHWTPREVPSNGYFQLVGFGLVFISVFGIYSVF